MRKLLFTTILFISIGCFIYTSITLNDIKTTNKEINKNIKDISIKINKLSKDNNAYTAEIEKLKKKNQSKDEELIIWEKAKEKLKKALS